MTGPEAARLHPEAAGARAPAPPAGRAGRPERPERDVGLADAEPAFLGSIRRAGKRVLLGVVDRGWFGFTPLQTHVVVCGFPRSGSTLLQLMVETCVEGAKVFGRETRALRMARYAWRNHAVMVTKRPGDIYWIDEIREFYEGRRAKVRFVLTTRDPRAVLTSLHARTANQGQHVTPEAWRTYYAHFEYARRFPDTLVVDFADLVGDAPAVARRLTEFTGWTVSRPFEEFHLAASSDTFDAVALNGIRPLDRGAVDRWRRPAHREDVRRLLRQLPELPERLIAMGFEPDTEWVREYA